MTPAGSPFSGHVLIVRTDHLGDMILTLPVASRLKQAAPGCRVTVLASRSNAEAARHHPAVEAVEVDTCEARESGLHSVGALAHRLRRLRLDAVLVAHPRPRLALATFLAGVPIRVGTSYRVYSFLFNHRLPQRRRRPPWKHEAEHNLDLLEGLGIPAGGPPVLEWVVRPEEAATATRVLGAERPVVIHPGHRGSNLNWSFSQYGELAHRLRERGYMVAITGSASETDLTGRVREVSGGGTLDLGGRLTIGELAAVIARSRLFVGASTGPTHLAAAVGAPVLAVYSPLRSANPVRWQPLGDRVALLQPRLDLLCRRCRGRACPFYHCMERHLSVDDAEQAALRLLGPSDVSSE